MRPIVVTHDRHKLLCEIRAARKREAGELRFERARSMLKSHGRYADPALQVIPWSLFKNSSQRECNFTATQPEFAMLSPVCPHVNH